MCMWIEEFAKTCVGWEVYIYVQGMKEVQRMKDIYIWIEEFAKTCGMGVGDVGGVYICVCGQKSSLRPVGWVQGMKRCIYIYMDRRVR